MQIVWDEPKRLTNLAIHAMDFAELTPEFFRTAIDVPAKQGRWMAINELSGKVVSVVYMRLGTEAISIVSMRPASRKERSF